MTSDPNQVFRLAAEACNRGDFSQALVLYRQLDAQIPGHPQILSALGSAEIGAGDAAGGVATLRRSLAVAEAQPDAWCNLARGLRLLQRPDDALAAADRALALAPSLFPAWACRGNILWDLGRLDDAASAYARAAALSPSDPRAHFNLANALVRLGRADEAIAAFRRALALAPNYPDAARNLAVLLCDCGRAAEAVPVLEPFRAGDFGMCTLYGMTLHRLGRFDDAAVALDHAVTLDPGTPAAFNNRGINAHVMGRYDAALADFDHAIAHDPSFADAIVNRGTLLKDLGRLGEAAAAYDAAMAVDPAHPDANWNKGLLALLSGDFASGWPRYEGRWQSTASPGPYLDVAQPQWRGEDIAGKTIYIWAEQGLGDFVQFCRYVPLVAARGARVLLQVPALLKPLIATLGGCEMVDAVPDAFDVHCPLLSLPLAFDTTLDTIPAAVPYLAADPRKVERFEAALGPGPRIGLQWSANITNIRGRTRHLPAEQLAPLFELPAAFHVLHKDLRPEDRDFLARHPGLRTHADAQDDLSDAAALISTMDLVITIDTVVAHLAGALGKPVWLMLPHSADWRWLRDREDTPWYPTMRLFRQPAHGDWASVVSAVKAALTAMLR